MHFKIKRLLFLLLTVACLYAAGFTLEPLREMRVEHDLTSEPVKGVSPQLVLATQVLAWGRGILIDVVWMRMQSLQQDGKYFEVVQLADWACKLAPRFPKVWDIQSWNMAYNVSCMLDNHEDRWNWIWTGIKLLRDQGIKWNPNAPDLYHKLAFMFFHKIGGQDDNAHFFYKKQFALIMHEALGGSGGRELLVQLAGAPRTPEELLKDESIKSLYDECLPYGFDLSVGYFEWFHETPSVPPDVRIILARRVNAEAMRKVAVYTRAQRLRDEFKLDPELMIALVDRYGDFDWRTPYPHAIYWAYVGLERLALLEGRFDKTLEKYELPRPLAHEADGTMYKEDESLFEFQYVQFERVIYGSMQSLVRHGRLLFDIDGNLLYGMGADYRFADATLPLFEAAMAKYGERFDRAIVWALEYFLEMGVMEFYWMGDVRKSREYYEIIKEKYPRGVHGRNYEQYLEYRLRDWMSSQTFSQARRACYGYLVQAYIALACNADEKAAALEKQARYFAKNFDPEEWNLRGIVQFDKIRESVLIDFFTGLYRLSPEVLANLKRKYEAKHGPGTVDALLARVKGPEKGLPGVERLDKKYLLDKE